VAVIQRFRASPAWRIVDVPGEARIMDGVWRTAAMSGIAYRRIFDLRLAATLRHHGVTDFATRNIKDFAGLGFTKVWDPLAKAGEPK
jgi:predicted nucleic acid-binding protein